MQAFKSIVNGCGAELDLVKHLEGCKYPLHSALDIHTLLWQLAAADSANLSAYERCANMMEQIACGLLSHCSTKQQASLLLTWRGTADAESTCLVQAIDANLVTLIAHEHFQATAAELW